MTEPRLMFLQHRWICKCYWKTENVNEVLRQRNEFVSPPPRHVTTARLCDKFEADGTLRHVNKGHSGWPHSAASNGSVETLLQAFT